jgi:TRAP transporter TAXI family solute receptor
MLNSDNPPIMLTEPTGSQDPIIADFMLKGIGRSLESARQDGTIVQISSSQMGDYINDNKAQVFIANGPSGHSTTTEVAMSVDMVPVVPTKNIVDALAAAGMPAATLPAGVYKGQTEEYPTNVSATVFLTHKDVEEEVVYNVVKALCENVEILHREHPPLRSWDPRTGAQPDQLALDMHPGALKYYKEMGWR